MSNTSDESNRLIKILESCKLTSTIKEDIFISISGSINPIILDDFGFLCNHLKIGTRITSLTFGNQTLVKLRIKSVQQLDCTAESDGNLSSVFEFLCEND